MSRAESKALPKAAMERFFLKTFAVSFKILLHLLPPVAPHQKWHLLPQIIGVLRRRGFPCVLSSLS